MSDIRWTRYPKVARLHHARSWLTLQAALGLSANTIEAYGRALEDYLAFSAHLEIDAASASRSHIAAYVHDLATRPSSRGSNIRILDSGVGLASATMQQRLTAVRLFYDYLVEEGLREMNPVGRGRYTPGKSFAAKRDRGLIPRYRHLPWIPTDDEWRAVLEAASTEPLRNRLMLALAYDAGLRREELCSLQTGDIDPAQRLLHVRAAKTKNRQARVVPYSEASGALYVLYLRQRQTLTHDRGPLFLSESRRNRAQPLTIWTWSKVIKGIARRSGVRRFTTHTTRHLCLTDLARAGWALHEISRFAGHRSIQSTLLYIHLSGRELAAKLARATESLHAERMKVVMEVWK
jgi:integrase/recombinase XerD